jgi:hypothetical protein
MEKSQSEGGDAVEPDALSYSLVIHAWLRGCRGFNGGNGAPPSDRKSGNGSSYIPFTDQGRIERAIKIVEKMEQWARTNYQRKLKEYIESEDSDTDVQIDYNEGIIDELDTEDDVEDESDDDTLEHISDKDISEPSPDLSNERGRSSPSFPGHNKARHLDAEVYK